MGQLQVRDWYTKRNRDFWWIIPLYYYFPPPIFDCRTNWKACEKWKNWALFPTAKIREMFLSNFETRVIGWIYIFDWFYHLTQIRRVHEHCFSTYRKYAWGYNELKPLAESSHFHPIFGGEKMMATMVDGADTSWIAGLKDSYNEVRPLFNRLFILLSVLANI